MIEKTHRWDNKLIKVVSAKTADHRLTAVLDDFESPDSGIVIRMDQEGGAVMADLLDSEGRIALAELLLSGLPIEQVRQALPAELFVTEWALRKTEPIGDPGDLIGPASSRDMIDFAEDRPEWTIVRRERSDWAPEEPR